VTREEFKAAGLALYGHDWQSALARAIGVTPRSVRRWASGEVVVPDWMEEKLTGLAGGRETRLTCRDEWLVAEGRDGRRYVIHAAAPEFIARLVHVDDAGDPEPDEAEADILTGVVYSNDDLLLCEVVWRDRPPRGMELASLFEAACDFIDAYDGGEI